MKTAYDIIIKPVITEQSMEATEDKKYVFQVAIDANKVEIKMDSIKTKTFKTFLNAVGADCKALVVTAENNEVVVKSAANIPGVQVAFANVINVYDILNAKKLVVDKAALAKIEEVFA